jgi:TP901 family phage tail tape measure protein
VASRADTAKLMAELGFTDKLTPGVNKALGSVGRLESGLGRVGKGAGQLSAGFARSGAIIAGAAVTGLGAAAKAAIDWEDAFAGVVKTVNEADLNAAGLTFDDLADSLRKMSTEMPNSAQELALIAEQAGAMGIAGQDIEAFTRQVAIMSSTTDVAAQDGATALGQMQNVIALTADEFDNFTASLVHLGNVGNSTESQILEIARRSGGAAKLFGIAKEETLGWAAAAANLGLNEELAGTALQNVFVKAMPLYIEGSKKLQKITGETGAQLKKSFEQDAGGALEGLIADLAKLGKGERLEAIQSLFGKGSGITRLVNGLADSYAQNLAPSLDSATESWTEATAAQIEFEKRNATVRSAIARLKNGVVDAAVSLGEGFAPALGRAADKLATFLGDDTNRSALKDLGKDIGDAIDRIDWDQVLDGAKSLVSVMKSALDWATRLFHIVNALPTEIKAAGLGFIGLNKLSGGLIGAGVGNIVGGLAGALTKSLAASIPLFGRAFVQPVFVTNMGVGGMGGGGAAAAGGGGGFKGMLKGALAFTGVGLVAALASEFEDELQGFATSLRSAVVGESFPKISPASLQWPFGPANTPTILPELFGGNGLFGGTATPSPTKTIKTFVVNQPKFSQDNDPDKRQWRNDNPERLVQLAKDREANARAEAAQQREAAAAIRDRVDTTGTRTKAAIDDSKARLAAAAASQRSATVVGTAIESAATRGVAPPIVSAIYAARPIITTNVHVSGASVTSVQTSSKRTGSNGASRATDSNASRHE